MKRTKCDTRRTGCKSEWSQHPRRAPRTVPACARPNGLLEADRNAIRRGEAVAVVRPGLGAIVYTHADRLYSAMLLATDGDSLVVGQCVDDDLPLCRIIAARGITVRVLLPYERIDRA
jgi:hypothetical protein